MKFDVVKVLIKLTSFRMRIALKRIKRYCVCGTWILFTPMQTLNHIHRVILNVKPFNIKRSERSKIENFIHLKQCTKI